MPDHGFYRSHLENDVMAWWLANGPDAEFGGVRTCYANSGDTLVSTDKYTWSQGRWVWLTARLSRAARSGLLGLDAGRPVTYSSSCGSCSTPRLSSPAWPRSITSASRTRRCSSPSGSS